MASQILRLDAGCFLVHRRLVLVDPMDEHHLVDRAWHINNSGYTAHAFWRDGTRGIELLHRTLIGAAKGQQVDHKNGDKLDNRRENLRICTQAENSRNRKPASHSASGLKGVRTSHKSSKFTATITVDKKVHRLGTFTTAEAAHAAYCDAARQLHGQFARFN